MTLSFITRWCDELPETYTALSPTPLNKARLIGIMPNWLTR